MSISFFPTSKAMDKRIAEQRIGKARLFRTIEDTDRVIIRLKNGAVLTGWGSAHAGVVDAFVNDRVRHVIRSVIDISDRPAVRIFCSSEAYEIFNWQSNECISRPPATLLSEKQAPFFRPCKKCIVAMKKLGIDIDVG